jgi:hypothetical protein
MNLPIHPSMDIARFENIIRHKNLNSLNFPFFTEKTNNKISLVSGEIQSILQSEKFDSSFKC